MFASEETALFPDEHLGNYTDLNWAIAGYNMTALNKAFHNLHTRGLLMYCDETLDSSKAVVVERDAGSKRNVLVVNEGLSESQFVDIFKQTREHLSHSPAMFLHDGCLGITGGEGSPTVRSFCGSASSALLLQNLLRTFKLPLVQDQTEEIEAWRLTLPDDLKKNPEQADEMVRCGEIDFPAPRDPHDITQFLVPNLKLEGVKELGVDSADFSIVDTERKIVVHAGNNVNASQVRSGLMKVSGMDNCFGGHVFLIKNGSASVLVFGDVAVDGETFSCNNTIWNADALSPVWMSGLLSGEKSTAFGDYVEKSGKQSLVVSNRRGAKDAFTVKGPSAIVFVDPSRKVGDASKINPEQARALAKQLGAEEEALVARITESKIPTYAAGRPSSKTKTSSWIEKIVN